MNQERARTGAKLDTSPLFSAYVLIENVSVFFPGNGGNSEA